MLEKDLWGDWKLMLAEEALLSWMGDIGFPLSTGKHKPLCMNLEIIFPYLFQLVPKILPTKSGTYL